MLRMVLGSGRRILEGDQLEDWVDWIKRSTRDVENRLEKLNLNDWVTTVRQRQWRWARTLVTMTEDRWAHRAIHWTPEWHRGMRKQARPHRRWHDHFTSFLLEGGITQHWSEVASTDVWSELESQFLAYQK